jgi:hypothetical protein
VALAFFPDWWRQRNLGARIWSFLHGL